MKGKKVVLLVIVLLLAGAGAGAVWTLHPMGVLAQGMPAPKPAPKPVSVTVAQITTNTADGHYAQVAMSVLLRGPKAAQGFDQHQAAVQDAIIGTLRSQTSEQMNGNKGMQSLAAALTQAMDQALGAQDVLHIYFTNFVVQ